MLTASCLIRLTPPRASLAKEQTMKTEEIQTAVEQAAATQTLTNDALLAAHAVAMKVGVYIIYKYGKLPHGYDTPEEMANELLVRKADAILTYKTDKGSTAQHYLFVIFEKEVGFIYVEGKREKQKRYEMEHWFNVQEFEEDAKSLDDEFCSFHRCAIIQRARKARAAGLAKQA